MEEANIPNTGFATFKKWDVSDSSSGNGYWYRWTAPIQADDAIITSPHKYKWEIKISNGICTVEYNG